jgi:1-acyl-sn-glycerol-3-phosphate acyltransferase
VSQGQLGISAQLSAVLTERIREVPRQPNRFVHGVRLASACLLRSWLKCYHRLRIDGLENLPFGQSFVIVSNHSSHLDALCLLSALPLRDLDGAYPVAAEDYFFVRLSRLAAASIFVNAIPFGRDQHVRRSMEMCRRLLRDTGNVLILFPEGTRSASGELNSFRRGVGSLLAGLDVPVVPCAIVGAHRAMPKGSILPRPCAIRVLVGRARSFTQLDPSRESAQRVSDMLHDDVKELLCVAANTR